jgi:transcriptional regulator with XRE-family HTH domain
MAQPAKRYPELGARLADYRERLRISQREAAERVRIGHSYIAKLENGNGRPAPHILERLADLYEAPYDELAVLAGYQRARPDITEYDALSTRFAQVMMEAEDLVRRMRRFFPEGPPGREQQH